MNGKNTGIARKIAYISISILLLSIGPLFAQKFPKPIGYVNDFAGVIDQSSKVQIEAVIAALNEKTGVEMAVVSIDTIVPYGTIEEYSIELATEWGIGKKGEDTGVLLLLAMEERKIRLEIGYGLEGVIPDGLAGDIIDRSILPSIKSGEYGTGLLRGVQAVSGIIAEAYGVELDSSSIRESKKYTSRGLSGISPILIIIIFLFLFGGGRFLWPLLFLGGVSRRGFYGGGFGSSSSRGGGFSGFGGGGFGGGGASRGF